MIPAQPGTFAVYEHCREVVIAYTDNGVPLVGDDNGDLVPAREGGYGALAYVTTRTPFTIAPPGLIAVWDNPDEGEIRRLVIAFDVDGHPMGFFGGYTSELVRADLEAGLPDRIEVQTPAVEIEGFVYTQEQER